MPVAKRPNTDDSNALVLAKKSKNEIVLSKIHNAGSLVQSGVSNTKSWDRNITFWMPFSPFVSVYFVTEAKTDF